MTFRSLFRGPGPLPVLLASLYLVSGPATGQAPTITKPFPPVGGPGGTPHSYAVVNQPFGGTGCGGFPSNPGSYQVQGTGGCFPNSQLEWEVYKPDPANANFPDFGSGDQFLAGAFCPKTAVISAGTPFISQYFPKAPGDFFIVLKQYPCPVNYTYATVKVRQFHVTWREPLGITNNEELIVGTDLVANPNMGGGLLDGTLTPTSFTIEVLGPTTGPTITFHNMAFTESKLPLSPSCSTTLGTGDVELFDAVTGAAAPSATQMLHVDVNQSNSTAAGFNFVPQALMKRTLQYKMEGRKVSKWVEDFEVNIYGGGLPGNPDWNSSLGRGVADFARCTVMDIVKDLQVPKTWNSTGGPCDFEVIHVQSAVQLIGKGNSVDATPAQPDVELPLDWYPTDLVPPAPPGSPYVARRVFPDANATAPAGDARRKVLVRAFIQPQDYDITIQPFYQGYARVFGRAFDVDDPPATYLPPGAGNSVDNLDPNDGTAVSPFNLVIDDDKIDGPVDYYDNRGSGIDTSNPNVSQTIHAIPGTGLSLPYRLRRPMGDAGQFLVTSTSVTGTDVINTIQYPWRRPVWPGVSGPINVHLSGSPELFTPKVLVYADLEFEVGLAPGDNYRFVMRPDVRYLKYLAFTERQHEQDVKGDKENTTNVWPGNPTFDFEVNALYQSDYLDVWRHLYLDFHSVPLNSDEVATAVTIDTTVTSTALGCADPSGPLLGPPALGTFYVYGSDAHNFFSSADVRFDPLDRFQNGQVVVGPGDRRGVLGSYWWFYPCATPTPPAPVGYNPQWPPGINHLLANGFNGGTMVLTSHSNSPLTVGPGQLFDDDIYPAPGIPGDLPLQYQFAFDQARILLAPVPGHPPTYNIPRAPPSDGPLQPSVAGNVDYLGWQRIVPDIEALPGGAGYGLQYSARWHRKPAELGGFVHPEYQWGGGGPSTPGSPTYWVVSVNQSVELATDHSMDGYLDMAPALATVDLDPASSTDGSSHGILSPAMTDQNVIQWINVVSYGASAAALSETRPGFAWVFLHAVSMKDGDPPDDLRDKVLGHELGHVLGVFHEPSTLTGEGFSGNPSWDSFSHNQLAMFRSRVASPAENQ